MEAAAGAGVRRDRVSIGLAAAGLAALSAWALVVHTDDTDAGLYRTVVRNLVADGSWFSLRYLPNVHPVFREHLPFGFWPYAVAERLGDFGPPLLALLASLATLALLARRQPWAAVLLGTTPAFFTDAALVRLDDLLVPLATLAGLLWWEPRRATPARWAVALLAAAAAVAIKGPFGLVPVVAAALAYPGGAGAGPGPNGAQTPAESGGAGRGEMARTPAWLRLGGTALLCAVAAAGPVGFLLWDRAHGGTWWSGYLETQVLASASGARTDGSTFFLYPFVAIAGRYWPWLPLVGWALYRARQDAVLRRQGLAVLLMLLFLCLPARKVWNHALVVYPFLSLWLAQAVAPQLERLLAGRRARALALGLVVAAPLALAIAARTSHCLVPAPAQRFVREHPGAQLAVVTPKSGTPWKPIAALADEYRATPWLASSLAEAKTHGAAAALTREGCDGGQPSGPWALCPLPR